MSTKMEMIVRAIERCTKMAEDDSMSFDQMKCAQKYFILTWRLLPPPPPQLNALHEGLRCILMNKYARLQDNCLSKHKFRLPLIPR